MTPARMTPAPNNRPVGPEDRGRSELRRRRDALAEQVTELHWDLGGLAYEMAVRDHFRLDVLMRRAAVLQERDAELAEVERLLRLEESGSAGTCPHCSAPHSRGAIYCWQCGATLMEHTLAPATSESSATTTTELGSVSTAELTPATVDGSPTPMDTRGGEDSTAVMEALLAPSAGLQPEARTIGTPTDE
jgi:hypothetical protein